MPTDLIKLRDDKAIRRKKKQILDAFNAKRQALKENLSRPALPIEEARIKQEVYQTAKRISQIQSSADDDGFANYEENKNKLEVGD